MQQHMIQRFCSPLCCLNKMRRFSLAFCCPTYSSREWGRRDTSLRKSSPSSVLVTSGSSVISGHNRCSKLTSFAGTYRLLNHFFQSLTDNLLQRQGYLHRHLSARRRLPCCRIAQHHQSGQCFRGLRPLQAPTLFMRIPDRSSLLILSLSSKMIRWAIFSQSRRGYQHFSSPVTIASAN